MEFSGGRERSSTRTFKLIEKLSFQVEWSGYYEQIIPSE